MGQKEPIYPVRRAKTRRIIRRKLARFDCSRPIQDSREPDTVREFCLGSGYSHASKAYGQERRAYAKANSARSSQGIASRASPEILGGRRGWSSREHGQGLGRASAGHRTVTILRIPLSA